MNLEQDLKCLHNPRQTYSLALRTTKSIEILLANESDVMISKIAPTLSFSGECSDNLTNTNDVFYNENGVVDPTQVLYEEGDLYLKLNWKTQDAARLVHFLN